MRRMMNLLLTLLIFCVLVGLVIPVSIIAEPGDPQNMAVYEEDFATYTYKDYTEKAEWDIWDNQLTMTPLGGIPQQKPAAAPDGAGGFFVIWVDGRNNDQDIYAQRLDSNGNRLWLSDVQVNIEEGWSGSYSPDVSTDDSGEAIVVWKDENDDVYAQKLSANGDRRWSTATQVNATTKCNPNSTLSVAVDSGGNAVISWTDFSWVYAQRLDSSGNGLWSDEVRVNTTDGGVWTPAVGIDTEGNATFAWNARYSDLGDIYAQRLDVNGDKLWPTDVRVNSDNGTDGQWHPAIDVDQDGYAVLVWTDERNGGHDLYAQRLNANGDKLWSGDVWVDSDPEPINYYYPPSISIDGNGEAIVVWKHYYGQSRNVYAQRIDISGAKRWPADVQVNAVADTVSEDGIIALSVSQDGDVFIAWENDQAGSDIYAQQLDVDGFKAWSAEVRVHANQGPASQYRPSVGVDASGNATIAWLDARNDGTDVYAQRLSSSGDRLWLHATQVNSGNSDVGDNCSPSVAVDSNGNAVIVWVDNQEGQRSIYAQHLDANGNKLWVFDALVNSYHVPLGGYTLATALDDHGNVIVVWKSGEDIYAQRLDIQGKTVWSTELRVNSDDWTTDKNAPSVDLDADGNAFVVWEYNGVYSQRVDADGNKLWSTDVHVTAGQGNYPANPDVSIDDDGNAVIVWSEQSGNVYAQRLNASGDTLWAEDIIVGNTEVGDEPHVKVDGEGYAVVVWEKGEWGSGKWSIQAQRLSPDGDKLWNPEAQASADIADPRRPSIGNDTGGNTVIVWRDRRHGNSDVYAQRLDTSGSRLWSDDIQVVSPDRFYFLTGIAQSRSVDAVSGDITAATLTSNFTLDGGALRFLLTNNGGGHWTEVTPGVIYNFITTGSDLRWRVEMTSDPVWRNRSPVIEQLRIEYETTSADGDDYEPDDTCAQARPLAVNGAVQAHTFHQQADEDWAWFDVISGTTYIVQTSNTQANADTELELRAACPQPPFAGDDNVFGNDARITWRASFSGPVYVKVSHHDPAVYGAETGYDLSVRTFTQPPVVVIVAGHDDRYSLQSNIDAMADMAYRTFLNSGVPKHNIRYFGPNPARDVDGNGLHDDLYATVTITGVREAVQNWSREQGVQLGVPFYVYLVDHGHYDQFLAAGSANKIWATDLNLWLSNLEATSGADHINVILEACKSGSFIDVTALGPAHASGHNRVVIASTSSTLNAYPSPQGGYFSDVFWTAVGQNQDLKTAFEWAKQAVQVTGLSQQPWLDDNGDAVADGRDGALARGRGLGGAFAGSPPVIDWAMVEDTGGQASIQAQVRDDFGVELVWAEVYAPDFVEPEPSQDGTTPEVNVPTTTLTLAGSDLYGATYPLTQTGNYRLVVYALDDEGNRALPQAVRVCAGCTFVYLPLVLR